MRCSSTRVVTLLLVATFAASIPGSPLSAKSSRPLDSVHRAHALREKDQDQAAIESLNRIIAREPKNALAYSERSMAYGKFNKFKAAIDDANKAVALAPVNATVYANRAAIEVVINQYENALADCSKASAIDPKLALAYGVRALVYDRQKNYAKSVSENTRAIALDPTTARYYFWRASAYRSLKQHAKALQDCTKSISLNPHKSQPHIERGFNYLCLGEYQNAVVDYTTAIKISPKSSEAYSLRARAYELLGDPYKHIDDLNKAIELNPKAKISFENRAEAYYEFGQLQKAISDANAAIALDSTSFNGHWYGAAAYYELGMYDQALELQNKLVDFKMADAYEWRNRANIYDKLGKYELANADRKHAYSIAPPNVQRTMMGCNPLLDFMNISQESPQLAIRAQLEEHPVVLPLSYDSGSHIQVPINLNGHDLNFMLDTGCGHSDFWKHANSGIAEIDKLQTQSTKANGNVYSFGFFKAKDFSLGHLKLTNVSLNVDDGLPGHKTISGFLGGNILENFVVTIDYEKQKVILSNSVMASKSSKAIVVPIWIRNHVPHCIVRLDNRLDVRAMIDTGCPGSLAPDSLIKPVLPTNLQFDEHTGGPWLGELRCESYKVKSMEVSGKQVEPPIFDVFIASDAKKAADEIALGNDFLSQYKTVIFDYPGRQLILEPGGNFQSAHAWYRQARYFHVHHQEFKAIAAYEKAMVLDPSLAAYCHYYKGIACSTLDREQEAIKEFTQAMMLDEDFAEGCYYHRGLSFRYLGEYQKSIDDCSQAIRLDPNDAWNYNARAWAYWRLEKFKLSILDNTTALRIDPKFESAYTDRAMVYEKQGQKTLAAADRAMAKKLSGH